MLKELEELIKCTTKTSIKKMEYVLGCYLSQKDTFNKLEVRNEIENIEAHCQKVKEKLET